MKILILPLLACFLCSCAVQTPQTRIERNHSLYESLSGDQQVLVQQGQIAEAMPSAGVYLAWGKPAVKSQGFREGKSFQRWDYTALQPHVSNHFSYGYGGGYPYGRRGRYGSRSNFGFGQSVDYVPYRSRSVLFRNDRVSSWEVASPPY